MKKNDKKERTEQCKVKRIHLLRCAMAATVVTIRYFIVKTELATDIPKASRHLWCWEHMHYESFDKIFDLMREVGSVHR